MKDLVLHAIFQKIQTINFKFAIHKFSNIVGKYAFSALFNLLYPDEAY